ncbi:MAG TPA: hypothetical protein VMR81_04945 [Patescibacteria group bacterium]|nr:hypothetical protein [Patescibacteria group bacterium]
MTAQTPETDHAEFNQWETANKAGLVTIIDIRNPDHLARYPFVVPVREAVICMYDFFMNREENGTQPNIKELSKKDRASLEKAVEFNPNSYTEAEEDLEAAYWLHKATKTMCFDASRGIRMFLKLRYPNQYDTRIYRSFDLPKEPKLYYFDGHEVAVIHDPSHDTYMGVSPVNIFNFHSMNKNGYNFTFPQYNGSPFQRSTSIILARDRESIIKTVQLIEGPESVWEDTTNYLRNQPSYAYEFVRGLRLMLLTRFISQWQNEE